MIELPVVPSAAAWPAGRALRQRLAANPLLVAGAMLVIVMIGVAVLAPVLSSYPADAGTATHPFAVLRPPSAAHWFGTDQVGRDVLSRVLYGARISPLIAASVLVIACAIGLPLGLAAGYFGGWLDDVIMRITDIFLAFPALLLALALAAVLPTAITPLIVQISLDFGGVILTASALSFLGLGAQDPTPDWGLMVSEGQGYFTTSWWAVTFPGLAILITAFAFNLLGDGLRDLLDPKRSLLR